MKKLFLSLTSAFFGVFFMFSAASADGAVNVIQATFVDGDGAPIEFLSAELNQGGSMLGWDQSDNAGLVEFPYLNLSNGEELTLTIDTGNSWQCASCSLLVKSDVAITINTSTATPNVLLGTLTQNVGTITPTSATRYVTVVVKDQDGNLVANLPVNAFAAPDKFSADAPPGYASGITNALGEFSFAVDTEDENRWQVSVDPMFSTDTNAKKYSPAFVDILAETIAADGETVVNVSVQKTDATITAYLVDGNGAPVTVESGGFANVNCFEPFNPAAGPSSEPPAFYMANMMEGESSATINTIGGMELECNAWFQGRAATGSRVTTVTNDNVDLNITLLTYDATVEVSFVDEDGNLLTDLTGAVDMHSVKDAEGNEFWGDFQFDAAQNGKATLDALGGYTYEVGTFLNDGEGFGGPGGGGGGDMPGGDGGDGMPGGDGGDGMPGGGDMPGGDGFEFSGVSQSTTGDKYIQNNQRQKVVVKAGSTTKVEVVFKEADGTLYITMLDASGAPSAYAFVNAMQADQIVKEKSEDKKGDKEKNKKKKKSVKAEGPKGPGGPGGGDKMVDDGFDNGWMNSVGGMTDADGKLTLNVAGGTTYEISGHRSFAPSEGSSMPTPSLGAKREVVTLKKDGTKDVVLREIESDWTVAVTATTEDGTTPEFVHCYLFDPTELVDTFGELIGGTGELPFISGTSTGHLGCMGYANDTFYRSQESTITTGSTSGGSSSETVVLSDAGKFYEKVTTTILSTTANTITGPDAVYTLQIPASCLADEGNVKVTIGTGTGYKVDDDNYPTEVFDLTFKDSEGVEISEVTDSCAGATWTQKVDDDQLTDLGLDWDSLTGIGHYNDENGWEAPASTSLSEEDGTVTSVIKEFSAYGVLGDQGLSTTTVKITKKPKLKKSKVTKRKKKSVVLTFKAVSGATYYKIKVQKRKKAYETLEKNKQWKTFKLFKNVTKLTKKVTKLKAGTYRFNLNSCNAAGCSGWTKTKTFTPKE